MRGSSFVVAHEAQQGAVAGNKPEPCSKAAARGFLIGALSMAAACQGTPALNTTPRTEPEQATPRAQAQDPLATCEPMQVETLGDFVMIASGDRYALFRTLHSWAAVDLDHARLTAKGQGVLHLEVDCGPDCVAYLPATDTAPAAPSLGLPAPAELRLHELRSDQEDRYEGELVAESQLPSHVVALRQGQSLGLLDARARHWLVRLTTLGVVSSVALSADADRLYALSRDDDLRALSQPPRFIAQLEVFAVSGSGARLGRQPLSYGPAELQDASAFEGALTRLSAPRVYRTDAGDVVLGHMFGCRRCAGHSPEGHVYRVVDADGGLTGAGGYRYFDEMPAMALERQVWRSQRDDRAAPPAPVPARVRRVLEAMKRCPRPF